MEPMTGIEPVTSSLPRTRSTKLSYIGTLLNAITTIVPDLTRTGMVDRGGFEPP
jgi:hypothetical protein